MKGLNSIGDILPRVLKRAGLEKRAKQYDAILEWENIVGKDIAKNAKPERVHRSVLKIRVRSSAWMNELQLMKPEILKKFEERFGKGTIRDIRFYLGSIEGEQDIQG